jgi:CelD/BcsL family acetyltransferase involved in cellulose biosynthesis
MNLRNISSMEELGGYREEWNQILEDVGNNNPFIEFEWVYRWLLIFGESVELNFYVVLKGNKAVAFFPFIKKKGWLFDTFLFAGAGQANYMDVVALEEWKIPAFRAVLEKVSKEKRAVFALHGLFESSRSAEAIKDFCGNIRIPCHGSQTIAPYIDLDGIEDFDRYLVRKSRKHGGDRKEKRLRKLGNVSFRRLENDELTEMFNLHHKRWEAKLDTSGFTEGLAHEFYKSLSTVQGDVLETRIEGLFVEGHLVAFYYGLLCRNRYVLYVLAHDDDFGIFSPGRMLLKQSLIDRHKSNMGIYDLSIGYESYKLDWNTGLDRTNKILFPGSGWTSKLGFLKLASKERLITLLKKSDHMVRFKRNTLGRLKNSLKRYSAGSLLKETVQFIYQKQTVGIYRIDRKGCRGSSSKSMRCLPVTLKEIMDSVIIPENREESVKRLYKKQRGYRLIGESGSAGYFWLNEEGMELPLLGLSLPLPDHSIFIDGWQQPDVSAICMLFENDSGLEAIYMTAPGKWKGIDFGMETVRVLQVRTTKVLGLRFTTQRADGGV